MFNALSDWLLRGLGTYYNETVSRQKFLSVYSIVESMTSKSLWRQRVKVNCAFPSFFLFRNFWRFITLNLARSFTLKLFFCLVKFYHVVPILFHCVYKYLLKDSNKVSVIVVFNQLMSLIAFDELFNKLTYFLVPPPWDQLLVPLWTNYVTASRRGAIFFFVLQPVYFCSTFISSRAIHFTMYE